ncbi:MAG: hypothetical protein FJX56_08855, partial [Alphaproteobacteria bacterium]|nr:hypothetical protein [Alphaproteobacteria bacterium]
MKRLISPLASAACSAAVSFAAPSAADLVCWSPERVHQRMMTEEGGPPWAFVERFSGATAAEWLRRLHPIHEHRGMPWTLDHLIAVYRSPDTPTVGLMFFRGGCWEGQVLDPLWHY